MSKVIYSPPLGPTFDFTSLNSSGFPPVVEHSFQRDETGGISRVVHTVTLPGLVFADGVDLAADQANLTLKFSTLRGLVDGGILEFQEDNGDVVWRYDGLAPPGPNATLFQTRDGVRINRKRWPRGDAAWATNTPFEIVFEMDVRNDPCNITGIQTQTFSVTEKCSFGSVESVSMSGTVRTCDGTSCSTAVRNLIDNVLNDIATARFSAGGAVVSNMTPTTKVITDLGNFDEHCTFTVSYTLPGGATSGTNATAFKITTNIVIEKNKAIATITAIYTYADAARSAVKGDAETFAGVTLSDLLPTGVNTPHTERTRTFSEDTEGRTFTATRVYVANWIHDPTGIVEFTETISIKRQAEGATAHRLTSTRASGAALPPFIQTSGLGPVLVTISGRINSRISYLNVPTRISTSFGSLPVRTDPNDSDFEIPTLSVDTAPGGESEAQFITTYTQTYIHDNVFTLPVPIPVHRLLSTFTPVTGVT